MRLVFREMENFMGKVGVKKVMGVLPLEQDWDLK